MNAVEIEEAISALAEQQFDAEEFPFAFLLAFGNKESTIKRLRSGTSNKSDIGGILQINPDIFGSMIQAVADEEERSVLGMHYTSVPNILKVLNLRADYDHNDELVERIYIGRRFRNDTERLEKLVEMYTKVAA